MFHTSFIILFFFFSYHDGFHDKTKSIILFRIPNSYLPFRYGHNTPSRLFSTLTRAKVRSTLFVLTPLSLRMFPSFGFTLEFSNVSPTILIFEFFSSKGDEKWFVSYNGKVPYLFFLSICSILIPFILLIKLPQNFIFLLFILRSVNRFIQVYHPFLLPPLNLITNHLVLSSNKRQGFTLLALTNIGLGIGLGLTPCC